MLKLVVDRKREGLVRHQGSAFVFLSVRQGRLSSRTGLNGILAIFGQDDDSPEAARFFARLARRRTSLPPGDVMSMRWVVPLAVVAGAGVALLVVWPRRPASTTTLPASSSS